MARKPRSAKSGAPKPRGLPTKDEILEFIKGSPEKVGKREIARAFGIRGDTRPALKRLLSEMAEEGTLAGNRKAIRHKGSLPPVAVLEVTGRDEEGDLLVRGPVVSEVLCWVTAAGAGL